MSNDLITEIEYCIQDLKKCDFRQEANTLSKALAEIKRLQPFEVTASNLQIAINKILTVKETK